MQNYNNIFSKREGEGDGEGMGGKKGEGKECGPRQRRGIALWLRFGRDSVYNTKAVCANDEFVNC